MLSTPDSFRQHYQALVSSGTIERDAAQARSSMPLPRWSSGSPATSRARKQRLLGRLFRDKDEEPPRGLYIHGEVGRGKTMLMDLFFQTSSVEHKRRAHFHEFMADVHERIYGYRQSIARGETRRWRRDRADGARDLRGGVAALLRRISRHRHRRCDDPRTAVRQTVRTRHRRGRDLQRRAGGSLQGRAEPRAVPALHRADRRAYGRDAARCAHRFPAGEARRASRCGWCPTTARRQPRSTRPGRR